MRCTCLTADTRRWIPWHAFKTLVSEHINTTEKGRTINTGTHARIHEHVCTHDCHHITPNHNPRAWTSNEASFFFKKSSGVINAFSYANVINAKLQSHYANRLFLEPLYKYSQLKSGISLTIFLSLSLTLLPLPLSIGVEIMCK